MKRNSQTLMSHRLRTSMKKAPKSRISWRKKSSSFKLKLKTLKNKLYHWITKSTDCTRKVKSNFIICGEWWFMKDQLQILAITSFCFKLMGNGHNSMTGKFNSFQRIKSNLTMRKAKYAAYFTKDLLLSAAKKKYR